MSDLLYTEVLFALTVADLLVMATFAAVIVFAIVKGASK